MLRYDDVTEDFVEMFLDVLEKKFSTYQNLKFKLLFDTKKCVNKGKIRFASMELANDKIKFFSKDNIAIDGYDYIFTMDKKVWELSNNTDRERLVRHELRHVFVDDIGKLKILPHDVEDFSEEIVTNTDDPNWGMKLAILVNDVYEQEREMKKESKE